MREPVFVDTSALYAVLDRNDQAHDAAASAWSTLLDGVEAGSMEACTHNGVVIEATALVQHRIGLPAVRALHGRLLPAVDVHWIDQHLHERALVSLLAAARRDVSLVDWTSFELMRVHGIDRALAFDDDFVEHGFELLR